MTKKSDGVRTCVGCRRRRPTQELVRVRWHAGALTLEPSVRGQPTGGRGAWLCVDTHGACARSADKTRAFDRAFRFRVPADAAAVLMPTLEMWAEAGIGHAADVDDGGRLTNRR